VQSRSAETPARAAGDGHSGTIDGDAVWGPWPPSSGTDGSTPLSPSGESRNLTGAWGAAKSNVSRHLFLGSAVVELRRSPGIWICSRFDNAVAAGPLPIAALASNECDGNGF